MGQAATATGLVGNIMIILVSAVAISNFLIPLNMMSLSIRVLKYIFLIAAAFLGLVGVVVCVVGFAMYLCKQRTFGQPYFRLFFSIISARRRVESIDGQKPLFLLSFSDEQPDQHH